MAIAENVRETIQNSNIFLTNFVEKHKLQAQIDEFIAPSFRVRLEAGRYLRYTEDIHRIWENKITGRQKSLEIQWQAEEESYACEEYGMSKFISNKAKAQAVDPIKLEVEAGIRLKYYQSQARSWRVWQIAGSAAIVTQTINIGAAWAGAGGTPVSDILTGMGVIEASLGVRANRILIPTQTALNMIQTTEWRNYFAYAGNYGVAGGAQFNPVSGLRALGLQPLMTSIRGLSTPKCTTSDPAGEGLIADSVLLFYCEPTPSTNTMTFMYSPYVFKDVMARTVEKRERGVYLDIYEDIDELLIEPNCAYLMTNCI